MTANKILITGSKGQLGIELLHSMPAGYTVTAVDINDLDIRDATAVRHLVSAIKPTAIINCAAYTAVDKAESDAETAFHVNRDGPRNLAEAASAFGARLVQISTDFVFDGTKSSPYLPEDPPNPLSVYGRSKLGGEQEVMSATNGDALIVRTAWLYSAHGNNFVKTMLKLMQTRPELRVVSDQVGTPTSATSLARAIWSLLKQNAPSGIYHHTDAGVASWYDFAYAIRQLAKSSGINSPAALYPIRTEDYPTPAKRPAYSVLDKTRTMFYSGAPLNWHDNLQLVFEELLLQNHLLL